MGGKGGELWRRITYRLPPPPSNNPSATSCGTDHSSSLSSMSGMPSASASAALADGGSGILEEVDRAGRMTTLHPGGFFEYLKGLLERHTMAFIGSDVEGLPFNFWGGLVGYLGYELKAECGGRNAHSSPTPDASFFLSDQFLALDHLQGDIYVLALYNTTEGEEKGLSAETKARTWVDATVSSIEGLLHNERPAGPQVDEHPLGDNNDRNHAGHGEIVPCDSCVESKDGRGACCAPTRDGITAPFRLRHSKEQYMANIESYRQALYDGESYEVRFLFTMLSGYVIFPSSFPYHIIHLIM